jgi:hypothetical protein
LASSGDVTAPEVGHHSNAYSFGQQSGLVDLQGVGVLCGSPWWLVANGLAVAANGRNVMGLQARLRHEGLADLRAELCQFVSRLGSDV